MFTPGLSPVQSVAMPEAVYRHRALTPTAVDDVWNHLQNPDTWATVAGVDTTSDHTHDGTGLTGFRFTTSIAGVTYRGTAQVTGSQPGQEMTLAIHSNELTGSITVELGGEESGTTLDVRMTMAPAGFLGTMIFGVVTSAVSRGFEESVERLATDMS